MCRLPVLLHFREATIHNNVKGYCMLIMKAALLLLILIQVKGYTTQSCPRYCTCKLIGAQAEWLRIKCGDHLQDIKDVDINAVSVELIQLDLSKNDIYVIEVNIFKNLTNLRRLDLSENKLTTIDEGSFNGLENLERLDLSKNQITTIDAYAFRKLSNLKRLDLSGNKLNTLASSLFHDLLALDRLKLNGNDLLTLKEGTFHGLKSLKQLDLSNNPWKCDCEMYWFSNWIHNASIKLNPPPKCASPPNVKGQPVKKLRLSEDVQCQWLSPAIEIRPVQNQVVFAGDSITLKCRAPSVTDDRNARLNWLWYPNTTAEIVDLNAYRDPRKSLSNIKVDNRYLSDSGIVDSSLSIVPVKAEHNGQWNCLLVSINGNRSKAISVIVISDQTRYCPLAVTKNNKGIYTWPRTVVGWRAELPCEGNRLSGLMQVPMKASYHCNITGYWEELNTESCPYISHTTKILEQFSKVNLSLTKGSLLETAKRFKNYTGNGVKLMDPVEINFITQTIENYLNFLVEEKELGSLLIDVVSSVMNLPKEMLKRAEVSFKSCTRLIKAVEKITEFTPSIQSHKKNIALEELRVKRESFTGLICTWYTNMVSSMDSDARLLHCTTNNGTMPFNTKDKIVEASIQLPASLLHDLQDVVVAHQLMISMYSDNRLFPKIINSDNRDISTCVVGSKLFGIPIQNLSEPVYVMLKAPLLYHTDRRPLPVVWDETLNGSGGWTTDGCYLISTTTDIVIFNCRRLGYYGLLQDISHLTQGHNSIMGAKFRYSNPAIYIGSFVVITCLVITSVTYIICFASITMPKKAKHCVINTWFAMALLSFLYSIGIQQTENVQICQGVGLTLHYLSLCCLLWMAVSASNMYKKFSKSNLDDTPDDELPGQPIPKPLLGLYLVGWGIALIICGISGAINLREYAGYSHCFLTSGPALAALFVPAGILITYLIIFHLLIRCAIQNVDMNAQLSEGTQATENMDLELLEPNTNPSGDRNSLHSTQTVSSDVEDPEHSQITQLKGQIIMLILYLTSWSTAAAVTVKPFNSYIPFEETIFAILHSISASSLGVFVLLFYGIARNDVRSQWLKMRCWLQKRKNQCCRTRSVSDSNPVIPTQPLVQNLVPPLSNSQATQVTSDTNSISSSRNTNRSQPCNASKLAEHASNQDTLPVGTKMANVNLVVLHRQQYRSNNSVTTYTEPSSACVEMFYNPHQSGVARKFFKKQRRHTKNNNLGPRKQGDGGITSDGGSCISIPRPAAKLESNIERSILSSSAKVNNTNIHVELNPINDIKNVNILSDSGGSISEERNGPLRFVIGQENALRGAKKINTDCIIQADPIIPGTVSTSPRNLSSPQFCKSNTALQESDADVKTDEERHLRNVSQQCSLEYSSEIESNTQMTSERSDQNLPDICETAEIMQDDSSLKKESFTNDQTGEFDLPFRRTTGWLYHSNSMYCLPIDHVKPLRNSHRSSLNDIVSLTSSKNCECSKPSLNDLQSTTSSNIYDQLPISQRSLDQSERSLSEINSLTSDNAYNFAHTGETYAKTLANIENASNLFTDEYDFCLLEELRPKNLDLGGEFLQEPESFLTKDLHLPAATTSIIIPHDTVPSIKAHCEGRNLCENINLPHAQQVEVSNVYADDSVRHSSSAKKETSV
ncbi:hypothetical protein KM043_006493 [Ampulex compressa]|nr:hypothetical protein KM043_006493 [Ampulex compressa]